MQILALLCSIYDKWVIKFKPITLFQNSISMLNDAVVADFATDISHGYWISKAYNYVTVKPHYE